MSTLSSNQTFTLTFPPQVEASYQEIIVGPRGWLPRATYLNGPFSFGVASLGPTAGYMDTPLLKYLLLQILLQIQLCFCFGSPIGTTSHC